MPAVPAPQSGPPDLVLHMGLGKTGTSSIQHLLHRNRARLAEVGVLYPQTPGKTRHTRFGLFTKPDNELEHTPAWSRVRAQPAAFRRQFQRQLLTEIDESGPSRVLVSDEALYGSSREALRRLCALVDRIAGSLRLVVYLRRQDDHLVSRYQQVVKVNEYRRLSEWIQRLDHSKIYDYYARLRTWERLLEPEKLVVRRYERDSFVDGSLFQDFFEAAGIDARAADLEQVDPVNESLDAEAAEFLRIVNLLRRKDPQAATHLAANHVMGDRLAKASTGRTLTAPASVLDPFMAQWEETNQNVAWEFLGDADGKLFRTPRKTKNTTTDQRLDPARLDHFLTFLEVPEQTHAPLRDLTECEAKNN